MEDENNKGPEHTGDPEVETITKEEAQKMVEEAKKNAKTTFSRDLSKKLGVNVFENDELDAYVETQKNKVDRTEFDALQKENEEFKKFKTERDQYALENALIKNKVQDDYQDKVKKLAKLEMQENDDFDYNQAVEKVVTDMPFFVNKGKKLGMGFDDENANENGLESFKRKRYKENADGTWSKKR